MPTTWVATTRISTLASNAGPTQDGSCDRGVRLLCLPCSECRNTVYAMSLLQVIVQCLIF